MVLLPGISTECLDLALPWWYRLLATSLKLLPGCFELRLVALTVQDASNWWGVAYDWIWLGWLNWYLIPQVAAWLHAWAPRILFGYWLPSVGTSGSCDLGLGCLRCRISWNCMVLNCPDISPESPGLNGWLYGHAGLPGFGPCCLLYLLPELLPRLVAWTWSLVVPGLSVVGSQI